MSNWPREIKPEDRVKYLIQARADLDINWQVGADRELIAITDHGDRLWVVSGPSPVSGYEAWYASDHSPEFLVGEFDKPHEARKALTDHVVVIRAVQQAWEDVAT